MELDPEEPVQAVLPVAAPVPPAYNNAGAPFEVYKMFDPLVNTTNPNVQRVFMGVHPVSAKAVVASLGAGITADKAEHVDLDDIQKKATSSSSRSGGLSKGACSRALAAAIKLYAAGGAPSGSDEGSGFASVDSVELLEEVP